MVAKVVVLQVIARMNLGGTSKYILKLSNELEAIGIKSPIATGYVQNGEIEDPDLKKVKPIRIKHLGRKISPVNDLKAIIELRRVILQVQPDVIHTHTFKAGFIIRVQRNKIEEKLGSKIKFIHSFHGHLFDDPNFNGLKKLIIIWIERYLSRITDQLITGGIKTKKDLDKYLIYGKVDSVSISPAIDKQIIYSKKNALNKFKINNKNRFRVLWVGRVTKVKNPYLLLEIAKSIPEFDFYLVGGGDLFERIKVLAPDNLILLGWQNIATVLPIADVFLSTSSNEGIPIAFIQAQLAGVPIVSTNVGSVSEVVIHNETGILCDKSNQKLIDALKVLQIDKKLRRRLSKNAKINILNNFTTKQFILDHVKVYQIA